MIADFRLTIVNKITYAIPACYGFLSKSHILQTNNLFKHTFKYGYVKSIISLEQLLQDYNDKLFHKTTYGNHAMHMHGMVPISCFRAATDWSTQLTSHSTNVTVISDFWTQHVTI